MFGWCKKFTVILTAFVSVATAMEMNTMVKVVTISTISAWICDPAGDVPPISFDGWKSSRNVYEAEMDPVSWAAT